MMNKLLVALFAVSHAQNAYERHLDMRSNAKFKIVQFSDMLIDESSEHFVRTQSMVQNIIYNEDPDLIVLTGDTVSPDASGTYQSRFETAVEFFKTKGLSWVSTGGSQSQYRTREEELQVDQEEGGQGPNLSFSGYRGESGNYTSEDLGPFTARIPIMAGSYEMFSVYILDSEADTNCKNGLNGTSCISNKAISWLEEQQGKYSQAAARHRRDIIFMHTPIPEFMDLYNNYNVTGNKQQPICCQAQNPGLFALALQNDKTDWIVCGKDNDNDFWGLHHNVRLAYGRKTGFDDQGELLHGARVFTFRAIDNYILSSSYIVDENGDKDAGQMPRSPPYFGITHQKVCCTDPFAEIFDYLQAPDDSNMPSQ